MTNTDAVTMKARIEELAAVIADQAEHVANGTHAGSTSAAVKRLAENVDTLKAWAELAREQSAHRG